MNKKVIVFAFIVLFYLVYFIILIINKKSKKHFLLSFVLTCVPFQIAVPLFTPAYETIAGSFTAKMFFTIPAFAVLIMWWSGKRGNVVYLSREEKWVSYVLLLLLVSLVNPHNHAVWSTVAFAWFFITCIVFARLMANNLTPAEIIRGFYESFVFLCLLQAVLATCFPLLGITQVTDLFQVGGEEWSTRNGSRPGAVGVFVHPGNLALFAMMASSFFLACYLTGYRKKISLAILLVNVFTVVLTYSRTAYLTVILVQFAVYYLAHNARRPLISWKSLLLGVIPVASVLYWLVFASPLSENFLASNADEMAQARLDHWLIGLTIFRASPLIGVGLNTHLEFIANSPGLAKIIHNEFLTTNPIHSIHIIVLAEMGLLGAILWVFFLVNSIHQAKKNIALNNNTIFSLTQIGVITSFGLYGITDWSPFSYSIFPFFLFITFFFNKYNHKTRPIINKRILISL